jgi:hypothetical protein
MAGNRGPVTGGAAWTPAIEQRLAALLADVVTLVCRSCSACCRQAAYVLRMTADEAAHFQSLVPHARIRPHDVAVVPGPADAMLLFSEHSGAVCPALGDAGCTIFADRPQACRLFPVPAVDFCPVSRAVWPGAR